MNEPCSEKVHEQKNLFHQKDISDFLMHLSHAGPLLGLDLGRRTTGIALSDDRRCMGFPLKQVRHDTLSVLLKVVHPIVIARHVAGLVVGFPLNLNGQIGLYGRSVQHKAAALAAQLSLPILLHDERLSTQAIQRPMREHGLSYKKRQKCQDQLAAAYILQNALDHINNATNEQVVVS